MIDVITFNYWGYTSPCIALHPYIELFMGLECTQKFIR